MTITEVTLYLDIEMTKKLNCPNVRKRLIGERERGQTMPRELPLSCQLEETFLFIKSICGCISPKGNYFDY